MVDMDKLVSHAKTSGFVFQGSEIYGGLANSWDYGPLGIELKNNIKKAWWKKFIQESVYNVGVDAAILMNSDVWKASGHLANFSDPLVDCKSCKQRFRADHLIEEFDTSANPDGWSKEKLEDYLKTSGITCPNCGAKDFTEIRYFQMMFKTNMGVVEDASSTVYLRPETAQGIFVNFKNVQRSTRKKIPFGIGQIGKSFRNEITPGNFIFRTREFEQMELEFFCKPGTDLEWFDYWKNFCFDWLIDLGIKKENLRFRDHEKEALSHYSVATSDIEYLMPFGWSELWGIADRTDFDLKSHQDGSKKSLEYLDPITNEKYIPYCIEPSVGVDRIFLTVFADSYFEELVDNETRIVMKIHPALAPYKVAILPLTKKLSEQANEVYVNLAKHFMVDYDEAGSIGKRYRRQDAIGTPLCVTFDFDSLEDQSVTIRNRDTMEQERVKIDELVNYINEFINY